MKLQLLPTPRTAVFTLDGFLVWCGSAVRGDDGRYHLYFSYWPKEKGHDAWVTHSIIGHAVAEGPMGPYRYAGIALAGAGGDTWDRDVTHNPAVIRYEGRYYMYYMGNYGDGSYWDHRNHQRVGVAWADQPEGPWHRFDHPIIDVSAEGFDSLLTSNPAPALMPDGRVLVVYKAVENTGAMPKGGRVICGVAIADHPLGAYHKHDKPIMINPDNDWSVEDPFVWYAHGAYHALVKDFQGYFTGREKGSVALFASPDGVDWHPAPDPFAFGLSIPWEDGEEAVGRLERPQILFDEGGRPDVLFLACTRLDDPRFEDSFNVHIKVQEVETP